MGHPYETLPARNFWRSAVGDRNLFDIGDLHSPRIELSHDDRFVTAGSCFAQHVSRAISAAGMTWVDAEPAPPYLSKKDAQRFNYSVFSFRTSNIYTAAMLRQWTDWASDPERMPKLVWEQDGRFFDPFRPAIEPGGFANRDELLHARERTLLAIRAALKRGTVLVFTLGLTEAWYARSTGLHYAACPGTLAGEFDPKEDAFVNLSYPEVRGQLETAIATMRGINPELKILLTVSPVPLTASAVKDQHVLVASTYSKSTLRAVAGDLSDALPNVDYFPSYEIITAPAYRGVFFEANMRSVNAHGVAQVMKHVFEAYGLEPSTKPSERKRRRRIEDSETADDVVCEDEVLEFYNAN